VYSPLNCLDFRFWSGQISCHDIVVEARRTVRAITERLVFGVAAAAQTYDCASRKPKRFSLRIDNFEVAFDADIAVILNRNFCGGHSVSEPQKRRKPNDNERSTEERMRRTGGAGQLARCRDNRRKRLREQESRAALLSLHRKRSRALESAWAKKDFYGSAAPVQ
jgi:hypothetical protein